MKMYRLLMPFLLVAVLVCPGARASEDIKREEPAVSPGYEASQAVLSYFEPLNGVVTEVDGQLAKVRFEDNKTVRAGMRLSALREGEAFYHPVTNELLGKTETAVGRVEIERETETEGLYLCRTVTGEVRPGDMIRIATAKTKLAFFQDNKADWSVSEAFYGALKDSGRFEIVESYTPSYEAGALAELAKKLDAEAALMFSTAVKDEKKVLLVKLYWAHDAKLFGVIEEIVGSDTFSAYTSGEEFVVESVSDSGPLGSYKLPAGMLLAMGDVNGNGAKEFIISDGNDIVIYDSENEFKEVWTIKGDPEDLIISMDVLDFNSNGRAELFVTLLRNWKSMSQAADDDNRKVSAARKGKVTSRIIEYDPSGGYRTVQDEVPYFIRVMGKTVLMQKYSANRIFSGPVFEAGLENGRCVPRNPLDLPDNVNIYGFTYIDWRNDGQRQVMTFNNHGLLMLYDTGGNMIWKGAKKYGVFGLKFKTRTPSLANPILEWVVRGRLVAVQTERGQEVMVVNQVPYIDNMPGIGGLGIKEAKVFSLWWDGGAMEENVVLEEIPGAVSDYRVDGSELFLIAKGNLYSFLNNATSGDFTKGSILYYYNLSRTEK